jgi:signal transduction histidine kinase
MRLPKPTMGQRLAFSYGTVVVLLMLVAIFGIEKLGSLSNITNIALKEKYPTTIIVNQLSDDLSIIARAMRNILIFDDNEQLEIQLGEINKAKIDMTKALEQIRRVSLDANSNDILLQIRIIHSSYLVNQEDFIQLVSEHKMGEARNLLLVDINGYQDSYFNLLEKLRQNQINLMKQASDQVSQAYISARNLTMIISFFAVLLSIIITMTITRTLRKKLGGEPDYAASIAKKIALGDLSSRIHLATDDHNSLLYSMSEMRNSLIERTNALQQTNRELAKTIETLNQAQSDLIMHEKLAALGSLVAGVAHELNTPIGNGIMACSSIIEITKDFETRSEKGVSRSGMQKYMAEMREATDILARNLDRAGGLISSFKQVAVDRTTSRSRSFSLTDVIEETLITMRPVLKKLPHQIKLDIPKKITMYSFPGPLGQVLTNLINNAILHAFSGSMVGVITISAVMLSDKEVEIRVSDNGHGISPDSIHRIYDPFYTTKFGSGGSGLGLHICHNIVSNILGGKINVKSELDKGSTFILTLPVQIADEQAL